MKEYDIFLKQRLTEGSIIVYSLPFRDGVSAVNRVVLRAMLSYFSLQKKIAVANQSALLSEIDEMLATVSEKIGDQVCLEASAALTIKYRNELEQAAMKLDITALQNLVGTLPEGAVSDTVVAYIKEYADGAIAALNIGDYAKAADLTAAIGRIAALEKDTHTHANKALLDTYDQTNEDLKDAVAKKHSHANKTELDKIAEGDKAKWDAAAAKAHEHANKTELDKIAEGDKANLDAVVAALTVGTF